MDQSNNKKSKRLNKNISHFNGCGNEPHCNEKQMKTNSTQHDKRQNHPKHVQNHFPIQVKSNTYSNVLFQNIKYCT